MTKKYERLFKIESSENDAFIFTVYRRNFSNKLVKVAHAKIIPGETFSIDYLKSLKPQEKNYLEEYFGTLANLKFEHPENDIYFHSVCRKNSANEFKRIGYIEINSKKYPSHYNLYAITEISHIECEYICHYLNIYTKDK